MILLEHVPEGYAKVRQTAEQLDLPLETVERKLMLVDHCTVRIATLTEAVHRLAGLPALLNESE